MKLQDLMTTIQLLMWKWTGHIARHTDIILIKKMTEWEPAGS